MVFTWGSINQSINQSIKQILSTQSISQSINQSINQSNNQSINQSTNQSNPINSINQIKSNLKSNRIPSNQMKSHQIKWNHIESNEITSNQIKSNPIKSKAKFNGMIYPESQGEIFPCIIPKKVWNVFECLWNMVIYLGIGSKSKQGLDFLRTLLFSCCWSEDCFRSEFNWRAGKGTKLSGSCRLFEDATPIGSMGLVLIYLHETIKLSPMVLLEFESSIHG